MTVLKYVRIAEAALLSHIDVLRQMGRILRRAGIPVKFSQGFNPHSLVFFSPPAVLGVSSLAEYVAIDTDMPAEEVFGRYNAAVNDNMRATEYFEVAKNPNLAGRIAAADYIFPFAAKDVRIGDTFTVEYEKKGEKVREDVRGKIYGVSSASDGRLVMRLAAGNVTLRPDRVFRTLKESVQSCGALTDTVKTAQYAACEGGFVDVDDLLRKGDRAGGPAGAPSMTK